MYTIDNKTIRTTLEEMALVGNKPFTASLHPSVDNILGVRVPQMRALAIRIAQDDWRLYLHQYTADTDYLYMEERMLHGLVLGYIKMDDEETYLTLVSNFVPIINSWSVCDSFAFSGQQRFVDKHKSRIWDYLQQWIYSDREYEIRFGVVMMMDYFICDEYIDKIIANIKSIQNKAYYVQMAVAWAVCECYLKFPGKIISLLHSNLLDPWTHNKSIQKTIESRRVSQEEKIQLRQLKR